MVEDDKTLAYWLAILQLPGMGPKRFKALYALDRDLSSFFNGENPTQDFMKLCASVGVGKVNFDWKSVELHLRWEQQENCHIITYDHPDFPPLIKATEGCPPLLYVKGNKDALLMHQIAIVGSRHPTLEGKAHAYRFAQELVRHQFAITSGLALGIDAKGHEGALAANGVTVAVLGSGLDNIYPSSHHDLANRICEKGALVSEFPLGTYPRPGHFPRRNRIISALSCGVLVVECSLKSGSLITANFALEQGREVFALPGSLHNPLAKGCHALIRQGAKCVDTIDHILEEFSFKSQPKNYSFQEVSDIKAPEANAEGVLLGHISSSCLSIDSLIERSGLTAEQVSPMLLELELQGEVASVPGGYVRITTGGTP